MGLPSRFRCCRSAVWSPTTPTKRWWTRSLRCTRCRRYRAVQSASACCCRIPPLALRRCPRPPPQAPRKGQDSLPRTQRARRATPRDQQSSMTCAAARLARPARPARPPLAAATAPSRAVLRAPVHAAAAASASALSLTQHLGTSEVFDGRSVELPAGAEERQLFASARPTSPPQSARSHCPLSVRAKLPPHRCCRAVPSWRVSRCWRGKGGEGRDARAAT